MEGGLILSMPLLQEGLWVSLRVGGMWMVMPVFGSAVLPNRIRLLLVIATAALVWVALGDGLSMPAMDGPQFWMAALSELAIGMLLGFVLRLVFEAMLLGAELMSLAMGLGFAQLNDPLRGTSAPVLGQLFSVFTTLVFLSLNGHVYMLQWLLWSYEAPSPGLAFWLNDGILQWSGWMFIHALQVALPALFALLLVNLGFGVISRSAPSLNLLAVGFPAALLLGLGLLVILAPVLVEKVQVGLEAGYMLIADLLS